MAGYDTANYIYNVYESADSTYGTPAFWIRYFSPCPDAPFTTNPVTESRAAYDSGGAYIGAISSPGASRLSANSSSEGAADAQTFAAALQTATDDVSQLELPSIGTLFCWLDMEPNTTLNTNYWSGWANRLNGWNWKSGGTYPLFASLYTRTCTDNGCSASESADCYAVWSQQPQQCGSVSNPPSFAPDNCSHCISSAPTTYLWQFMIQGDCNNSLDVDLDVGRGGYSYNTNCLRLTSRP